ncbi:putative transporter, partial [Trichonephila inaurata madagascariensis]
DGLLSALPYIVQSVCAVLVSYLVDKLRKSGRMKITTIRKISNSIGTLYGITNTISNINGIIGPMIVGYFTHSGATIVNWNYVFYITAAMYSTSAIFYNLFASAEPQPWGVKKSESEKHYHLDTLKS